MKKGHVLSTLLLTSLLLVACAVPVLAQQDMAKLEGIVRDASGAVVPGATVTARSAATRAERTTTTSENGIYVIAHVRPGKYALSVSLPGFAESRIDGLEIGVGQVRNLDFQLKPGGSNEQIIVTAGEEPATIDLSSNRLGVNVTAREVSELPVNGRNYAQLQLLTPGATNTSC